MSLKELGRPTRPILEWDEVDVNDVYKDPAEEARVEAKAAEAKPAKKSFWDRLRGSKK